jgi:hypothetical protein
MSIEELESEALKLSEAERAELAERLLASLRGRAEEEEDEEDPIMGLGRTPVSTGLRESVG